MDLLLKPYRVPIYEYNRDQYFDFISIHYAVYYGFDRTVDYLLEIYPVLYKIPAPELDSRIYLTPL